MIENIWIRWGILAVLLLAAAHLGCAGPDSASASTGDGENGQAAPASNGPDEEAGGTDEDDEDAEEPVPVEVTELGRGMIESVLRFSSNLEAEDRVQVFSQAKRLVTELLVEEGDRVRKGQVLLRLQDDEQRSALEMVRSQLRKAEREYEQQKRLYARELISEQDFNNATFELDQLQISVADAERELGYTEVGAPISGTVTERVVNLGDQVQIGQHLFDIVDFDSLVARVFVPEKYLRALRTRLPARISAQATQAGEYLGKVKRIAPIVDPRSGTVKVTVDVGGQPGLRPGMYVDVELVTATHADAVLVPKRAVVYDNDQTFVYRLDDESRVERVFIEPLLSDKYNIEPAAGLESGDRIVIAGQAGLKEGALVSLPGQRDDAAKDEDSGEAGAAEDAERASL